MPSIAAARASADSSGTGHDDCAGVTDDRPGGGAAAPADHPPLHRREVLGLVDQHVGVAVVLDPVGRRRPGRGAGAVLALRGGRQLLQSRSPPSEVVELVVLLARGRGRRRAA